MLRRKFLADVATGLAAWHWSRSARDEIQDRFRQLQERLDSATSDEARWQAVREQFSLDPKICHLNCGSIGASPKVVVSAIQHATREIETNPYHHQFGDGIYSGIEALRGRAAKFVGAAADEVALIANTTSGMNAIANGLHLSPGDEVLTTNHEHPGGMVGWQHLVKHQGVKVVCVELPPTARSESEILQRVTDGITTKTRVFSFSHLDTITGTRLPNRSVIENCPTRKDLLRV